MTESTRTPSKKREGFSPWCMLVRIQPISSREEPSDTFPHEAERTLLIFLGLHTTPDKISRKFVFGFKGSRKLHYKFKTEFARYCLGFF